MPIDRAAFIENYVDETRENLRRIDDGVVRLKKDPENQDELGSILRALHTIKGSSRMLKFRTMEQVAHGTESVFKGIREQRYALSSPLMRLVFFGGDLLRRGVESILKAGTDDMDIAPYLAACEHAYADEPFVEDFETLQGTLAGGAAQASRAEAPGTEGGAPGGEGGAPGAGRQALAAVQSGDGGYDSVRVKTGSVSQIIETLNTVIIRQFQFKQIQEELGALERGFSEFWTDTRKRIAEAKRQGRGEGRAAFLASGQALLKATQSLRKEFVDQMAVLEQNSYKLQEQVMRLSMLPLDLILGELPRMVAETSAALGKEMDFVVTGSDILMDKAILERLSDPLLHLVRNSVDHGIETPAERAAAGKSATGRIGVACSSESGNIVIRVTDDGKGIDPERIKRRAVELGLLKESDAAGLEETEAYAFMFRSGFSTKETVSELSGRGVGLDIVKYNVDKIKGKVSVRSVKGRGSEFILSVPLSLATVSGFFVKAGGEKFLIPSNFVQKIVRLALADKVVYYGREAFKLDGQIVPLYSLATLVGRQMQNQGTFLYVVVVESVGEKIGIVVDAVLQHAALIYKPTPRNVQKLKPIQGIVFDESYRIINILFVPELIARFKRIRSIDLLGGVGGEKPKPKQALVVDDSINTREIEKSILELEGFEVTGAEDGIEALKLLKERRYDLILSDIEMPRMDGITMIENIRKDSFYANTPIVVVTSYSDEATKKRAREAGSDAQIVKSDFDRNGLIEIVEGLMGGKRAVEI
jgi:two-component system chemotaxis sensor kinase CheA